MKWAALVLILGAAVIMTGWLRTGPRQAPWLWGLLTFLPFVIGPFNLVVSPYAIPMWSGYVKGWEVSLLDAVAFAVVFGTRRRWPAMVLIFPLLAYILAAALAVIQARFPLYAAAYPLQLVRVFLVFLAVAKVAQMEEGERALLTGLVCGITLQAGFAIWDRINGDFQTGGSLGHQNLLGFVSHLAILPLCGMFMARRWHLRALIGLTAGLIAVVLTGSRATILIAGSALTLTLILSLTLRFSIQKLALAVTGFILLIASAPLAYSSIEKRLATLETGFTEKDEQRVAFERAAKLIIASNPFGIGPNHYVFTSITEGFADRAGVNWSAGNRAAHVHQLYLLVTAETGILGLTALCILFMSGILYASRSAFRFRKRSEADIMLGLACALLAISLHSVVEWVFVDYVSQYAFAGSLGLIVGLRSRLIASHLPRKSQPTPLVSQVVGDRVYHTTP